MNANIASSPSDLSNSLDDGDEESSIGRVEEDDELDDGERTPGANDGQIAEFDWDDVDTTPGPSRTLSHEGPSDLFPIPQDGAAETPPHSPPLARPPTEGTPLLRKAVSFSNDTHPTRHREHGVASVNKLRRASAGSAKSVKYHYTGKSTFGQTVSSRILARASDPQRNAVNVAI